MAISQAGLPTTGSPSVGNGAVYWVGQDNNIYYKAPGVNGVQNLGAAPNSLGIDNNPNNGYGITANQINLPGANYAATLISDPALANSGGSGGGTGTGSTTTDPNAVAYYTDLINQLTTQLQGAQAMEQPGLNNINNAYDLSVSRANQSQSNALSGLETQRGQNATARENNIGSINQNAYGAYNSLMSLLGAGGAGVSSAATNNVPYAVAKNASGQRAGADYTFNTNESGINTAVDQTKQGYQNALTDLLNQKNNNTSNFETNLLNQEGSLNQQIAAAQINRSEYGGMPYASAAAGAANTTQRVQDIQNRLNSIFSQYGTPNYTVQPVNVQTPTLASFTVDPATVAAQHANPGTDPSVLPYMPQLQQNPNLLTGSGVPGSSSSGSSASGSAGGQQNV